MSFKLTVGSTVITDDEALTIVNRRPENNISSLAVQVNDYKSKNYVDVFDVHTALKLDLADNSGATYTERFDGLIHNLKPVITAQGEVLEVQAWGLGIALAKTTCNTSYGVESANPTIDTPEEILDDILTEHVEKRWGGAATQWSLDETDIDAPHADLSVTYLNSPYLDNFTLVNRLCDLINAHAVVASDISVHWYVDVDGHFRMKEIDADATDGSWDRYYGGTATTATLYEEEHFISRGFHKHIEDYANHIVLAAGFRKPTTDRWTEATTGWDDTNVTLTADPGGGAGEPSAAVVGTNFIKAASEIDGTCYFWYDFAAAVDFTKVGSRDNPPRVNFFLYCDDISDAVQIGVNLYTARGVTDFNYVDNTGAAAWTLQNLLTNDSEWQFISFPFGPHAIKYFDRDVFYSGAAGADRSYHWSDNGGNWASIAGIEFQFDGTADRDAIGVDDLHFSGQIIRSCYDTSEITATNKERQVFMRLDSAVDDTLIADDDDAGMAAMIAVSELYRRKATPVVGTIEMPLRHDLLPGHTLQIYAGKKLGGTYQWSNTPMRCKEVVHTIVANKASTIAEVTSDVTNTFASNVPNMWDLLMDSAGALGHGQAKDLKNSGVDNLISVLGWDPT